MERKKYPWQHRSHYDTVAAPGGVERALARERHVYHLPAIREVGYAATVANIATAGQPEGQLIQFPVRQNNPLEAA